MGRINLNKVSKLMDIANRFADGEDTCNNKRTCSLEDDHSHRYTTKSADLTIMMDTVGTIKWPQVSATTTIGETSIAMVGTTTTIGMSQAPSYHLGQGRQGIIIIHLKIS
jgi:hypothetical protein